MSARFELEADLAKAEADWLRAKADLDRAQANLAKANADWDWIGTDRRKAGTDRRKSSAVWDQRFPDRRELGADRRSPGTDIAAFSKMVADQHDAYLRRSKPEDDLANAEASLNATTAVRNKAIAALDALNRTRRNT